MKRAAWVVGLCLVVAACGSTPPPAKVSTVLALMKRANPDCDGEYSSESGSKSQFTDRLEKNITTLSGRVLESDFFVAEREMWSSIPAGPTYTETLCENDVVISRGTRALAVLIDDPRDQRSEFEALGLPVQDVRGP